MKWLENNTVLWALVLLVAFAASVLVSKPRTLMVVAARGVCGLFCAITITPLVMKWTGMSTPVEERAVAGLMMVTGYALVRLLTHLQVEDLRKLLGLAK
ncbi:preprotein translocase subunit SecF [Labrenzia sp. EL_208]|nr:preprotein translocase subunit SecF [Labrenzia sp. EL_132]MBG6227105.1 preprotein translocase subunit SecF [Labrenzia sp. EL_208]